MINPAKTVLVTGATSGFGEAMAVKFAAAQHRIIITGRRAERLELLKQRLEKDYGVPVLVLCFDIRDRQACFAAVASIPETFAPIDILINNAGGAWGRDNVADANLDDWETMLDTNVKGLMYMTKALLPQMIARKQGHIVNIGSIAGKEPYENGNGYNAAKFAVEGFSRALRIDLLPHHIKVTHVAPGAAETEFSLVRFKGDDEKAAAVYKGYEPLTAGDVADVVYYTTTLPQHVCINDLTLTPTAQANSYTTYKS